LVLLLLLLCNCTVVVLRCRADGSYYHHYCGYKRRSQNGYDDCGSRLAVFFHATTDERDGHIGSVNAPDVFALIRFTLDLAKREEGFSSFLL
jgi:hypothetical protein